ncbi:peptidoglycan-binding protein [Methylobacterium sp. Leaf125]|nr:peptidoglycan-binding protein [Methylobacterium sp. Leaf125]
MTRRDRSIWSATGFMLGMMAGVASAQGPAAPPPSTPPPSAPAPGRTKPATPDPAFEAARTAFEALPEGERKGLQDALVWTGDYNSVVNGTFGRRSFEALQAYAKRSGGTGLPDATGRAALLREGAAARAAARFVVKPDPASGVVLGVPERVLPKRAAQPGGTRWQSADGRITLETKSSPAGETGLEAVFARVTAPSPDRRVTYKLLRPDFLVVTAETATGKSYIRYAAGEAGLRGLTLGYDKALAGEVDRLAIAIANSFVPFPDAAPAAVAAPVATAVPAPAPPPLPGTRPAPLATGLLVAPGHVLTSAVALAGCRVPLVAGQAARVGAGATADLILLETGPLAGRTAITPPVRGRGLTEGEAVAALVIDGEGGVAVAPGQAGMDQAGTGGAVGSARITAPLQPGAGGAPILDRAGAVVGLVQTVSAQPRQVAGVVPPARYGLVTGAALATFLGAAGVGGPSPRETGASGAGPQEAGTLGAAAAALAGAVVAVTCQP